MAATKRPANAGATAGATGVNEVRLVGRVSQEPGERVMPSGDVMRTLRVIVDREEARAGGRRVDAIECAVWPARLRRVVATWRAGDVVEVSGALRRRFYRTGGGAVSRVEVEVASAKIIRRSATS